MKLGFVWYLVGLSFLIVPVLEAEEEPKVLAQNYLFKKKKKYRRRALYVIKGIVLNQTNQGVEQAILYDGKENHLLRYKGDIKLISLTGKRIKVLGYHLRKSNYNEFVVKKFRIIKPLKLAGEKGSSEEQKSTKGKSIDDIILDEAD